jgi:cytoskeleton protein RodZ
MSETNTNDSEIAEQGENSPTDAVNEAVGKSLPEVSIRLTEARVARGMSREEIAERLFLNVHFIECIDKGEFERIKKPAFLKGYLRSYARELGLSGDEIVTIYEAELEETEVETSGLRGVTEQKVGSSNFTGPVATTGIYGLIGIVLILLAIWWLSPEPETLEVTSTPDQLMAPGIGRENSSDAGIAEYDPVAAVDEYTGSGEPGLETATSSLPTSLDEQLAARVLVFDDVQARSAEVGQTEIASADLETSSIDFDVGSEAEQPGESLTDDANEAADTGVDQPEILISRSSYAETQLISVTAGGDDHLQIVFTDDCWLEIEDASGNLIYGDLNHDMDVLDLFGRAPFKLLVGRVSAITVTFNDRIVKFEGNIFNDTAKVVIE